MKKNENHLVRRQFFPVILVFLLIACASSLPASTGMNQKYMETWAAQLEKYRADFVSKDKSFHAVANGMGAGLANEADPWGVLASRVFDLSARVRENYAIAGRGETLKAFITHMQSNPSPGLSEVWFQRQAEDVQTEARSLDARTSAFLKDFDNKARRGSDWVLEIEELARAHGMVQGKVEELKSLYMQAGSYYRDVQNANAEAKYRKDQQAQAALATLGLLNQMNYQQQMVNTLNRPRTCSFFMNTMTCQ